MLLSTIRQRAATPLSLPRSILQRLAHSTSSLRPKRTTLDVKINIKIKAIGDPQESSQSNQPIHDELLQQCMNNIQITFRDNLNPQMLDNKLQLSNDVLSHRNTVNTNIKLDRDTFPAIRRLQKTLIAKDSLMVLRQASAGLKHIRNAWIDDLHIGKAQDNITWEYSSHGIQLLPPLVDDRNRQALSLDLDTCLYLCTVQDMGSAAFEILFGIPIAQAAALQAFDERAGGIYWVDHVLHYRACQVSRFLSRKSRGHFAAWLDGMRRVSGAEGVPVIDEMVVNEARLFIQSADRDWKDSPDECFWGGESELGHEKVKPTKAEKDSRKKAKVLRKKATLESWRNTYMDLIQSEKWTAFAKVLGVDAKDGVAWSEKQWRQLITHTEDEKNIGDA